MQLSDEELEGVTGGTIIDESVPCTRNPFQTFSYEF
jgi:hypothetical protein